MAGSSKMVTLTNVYAVICDSAQFSNAMLFALYRERKLRVMSASAFVGVIGSQEEGKEESLWSGFSRFQVPESVLRYKGNAPSQVYLLLFRLGCSASYHAKRVLKLTVSKSQAFISRHTRL